MVITVTDREIPPGTFDVTALGEITELIDGSKFPRWVEVRVVAGPTSEEDDPRTTAGVPAVVDMRLEVVEGYTQLAWVRLSRVPGGPPMTNATMKGLNMDRLMAYVDEQVALKLWMRQAGPGSAVWVKEIAPPVQGKRRTVTEDLLRQVAEIYTADDTGRPTAAVADKLFTGHRNAARYVRLARERGLIPTYREEGI